MLQLVSGLIIAVFFAGSALSAEAAGVPKKLHFFSGLFPNIASCFSGYNLIGFAAVPASTAIMVNTDFDERMSTRLAQSPVWSHSVDVGFLQAGNFIAAVPHSIMFAYGYFWGTSEWAAAGAAGLQALGINGGIVLFLEWASGHTSSMFAMFAMFAMVAAGAIIGTIVGFTVGKNFRKMHSATKTEEQAGARKKLDWSLWPTFSSEGSGLALVTAF